MSAAGSSVVITYNATDITDHVVFAETRFSSSAAANPGRATIKCKDPGQELAFTTGKEITLTVDGSLLWGGYVLAVDYIHAFAADDTSVPATYENRMFELQCVDYNILFDKRVIRNTANYTASLPSFSGATMDGAALKTLLANYIDVPSGFDITTEIDDVTTVSADTGNPATYKQQGTKLREQFEAFALRSAGVWYISPDKAFHYHDLEDVEQRWGFSDVPNLSPISANPIEFQGSYYPFREVTAVEDGTLLLNDALVWGGSVFGSGGTIVFSREQDATSITDRGRWQTGETYFNGEDGMGIQSGVDARADAIVQGPPGADALGQQKGYGNSQWQFRFRWYAHDVPYLSGSRDHIKVGSLVTIEMQSFFGPAAALILPCRQLDISFAANDADGLSYVVFDGDFALNLDDPAKLWAFIRAKRSLITSAAQHTQVAGDDTTVYGAFGQFVPTPTPNGVQTVFSVPFGYITTQLNVYLNGLLQRPEVDFVESDNVNGEFTMTTAPSTGDKLYCTVRTLAR